MQYLQEGVNGIRGVEEKSESEIGGRKENYDSYEITVTIDQYTCTY